MIEVMRPPYEYAMIRGEAYRADLEPEWIARMILSGAHVCWHEGQGHSAAYIDHAEKCLGLDNRALLEGLFEQCR